MQSWRVTWRFVLGVSVVSPADLILPRCIPLLKRLFILPTKSSMDLIIADRHAPLRLDFVVAHGAPLSLTRRRCQRQASKARGRLAPDPWRRILLLPAQVIAGCADGSGYVIAGIEVARVHAAGDHPPLNTLHCFVLWW